MTSKSQPEDGAAAVTAEKPAQSRAEKREARQQDMLRKSLQDENAGRGGSFVLDPSTGTRVRRNKTPEPKA